MPLIKFLWKEKNKIIHWIDWELKIENSMDRSIFIYKNNPINFTDEPTINQTNCNVVDGIDLDEIKEFAKAFKLRRLSLGLTQTQVGQALSVTEGPAYSQSAICRSVNTFFIPRPPRNHIEILYTFRN